MGAGRGSDGSLTIGTGSTETGREAGNVGRAADVVRDLDTGTSAAGVGGCTDAVLDDGGVAIEIRMGGGGGGGGGGIPDVTGTVASAFPFCFIISTSWCMEMPICSAICPML